MFAKFWNDESGASAAEYALILAIVGSAIAASMAGLGNKIAGAMDRTGVKMDAVNP
jgi:pilus assembly protein Flp/PilA